MDIYVFLNLFRKEIIKLVLNFGMNMLMMVMDFILIPIVIIDNLYIVKMNLIILIKYYLFLTNLISKEVFNLLFLHQKSGKLFPTLFLNSKL